VVCKVSQSGKYVSGEWDDDAYRAWAGTASDFTLVLDERGLIRGVGSRRGDLWRDLGGASGWLGQPWAVIISPETRVIADRLLGDAAAGGSSGWHLVDHRVSGGRSIPMLCSATRSGTNLLVHGRDLTLLDFTSALMEHGAAVACTHADAMRSRGMRLETLLLDVLAPTARRLGDLWMEDACTFTDVTAGLGGLHEVLHAVELSRRTATVPVVSERRILLTTCPGEQHTFGLAVVAVFFRQAGWHVQREWAVPNASLVQTVKRGWFDVVGLSASCEDRLDALAQTIRMVRHQSCNPEVRVLVGGHVFTCRPELAARVGADAAAFDGRQAVHQAQRLLSEDPAQGVLGAPSTSLAFAATTARPRPT